MKVKAWIDSGANILSKRVFEIEFDDDEWSEMTATEKDEAIREYLFEYLAWGYEEN